jgi:hypothetical protein
MNFRIKGLPLAPFAPLFDLDQHALAARGVVRRVADRRPGFPCRVSLRDADPGETVLLLNFEHLPVAGPYRASHAIYVREHAQEYTPEVNEVPELLRTRLLSVRAYDTAGMMVDAEVVDGAELEGIIDRLLTAPAAAYLHLHNAKPGCFAASVLRA